MELRYIWVKEYKNLKKIGFNFNSSKDEYFEFIDGKLNISSVENIAPRDFFSFNIKGLTAIVGKNGSGKTNLSEFLNYNLAHVHNGGLSTYIKGEGIIVLGNFIFYQEQLKIENIPELEKLGYKTSSFKNAPLDEGSGELRWHEMEKNKYIYYNPVFDFRTISMNNNWDNIYNISTNYLVLNDIQLSLKHHQGSRNSFDRDSRTDTITAHYRNEKLRESDFLLSYPKIKELIRPIPTRLTISVDVFRENRLLNDVWYSEKQLEEDPKKKETKELYDELRERRNYYKDLFSLAQYKSESDGYNDEYNLPESIKREYFKGLLLTNFFSIYLKQNDFKFPKDFFRKFIFNQEYQIENPILSRQLDGLKNTLEKFIANCKWNNTPQTIKNPGDLSYSLDEHDNSIYDLFRHTNFEVDTEEKTELFKTLITKISDLLNNNLPFHYQFNHPFSSGEQTLINFYSRFYWASKEISISEKGQYGVFGERVVIFIDEGEVSYHPEWQRRFFKLATDFLSELFKEKEIQLILTTHSPFVLSDIPKENIIFLNKDKGGNAEIKNFERDKTFGANIYTLLSDSFFMDNGTIGEFAKKKIEWVVEILDSKNPQLNPEILKEVNYIIDGVGEPLLKQQLEILRSNSLNEDKVSILEKKVQKLENELRNKSSDND